MTNNEGGGVSETREYRINADGERPLTTHAAEVREGAHFLEFLAANGVTVLRIRLDLVETVETDPRVSTNRDGIVEIRT
jgi:hypothetical protein